VKSCAFVEVEILLESCDLETKKGVSFNAGENGGWVERGGAAVRELDGQNFSSVHKRGNALK